MMRKSEVAEIASWLDRYLATAHPTGVWRHEQFYKPVEFAAETASLVGLRDVFLMVFSKGRKELGFGDIQAFTDLAQCACAWDALS